jgi:hypothetical protein
MVRRVCLFASGYTTQTEFNPRYLELMKHRSSKIQVDQQTKNKQIWSKESPEKLQINTSGPWYPSLMSNQPEVVSQGIASGSK